MDQFVAHKNVKLTRDFFECLSFDDDDAFKLGF